jgi:FkbM family methyltransferase
MINFNTALKNTLDDCSDNNFTDNWDYRRFGPRPIVGARQRFKGAILSMLAAFGIYKGQIGAIRANKPKLEWLYNILADEESKDILIKVLAYRMLGHRKVKLPLNTADYWTMLEELDQMTHGTESIDLGFKDWKANKFNLKSFNYPIELFARPMSIFTQMLLQQYRCQAPENIIEVMEGDIVIDAGACYGDTALNFAYKAGKNGKVFSFEFMPENLTVLKKNMELNSELAKRITLVERPLWSISDKTLFVEGRGPSTRVVTSSRDPAAKEIRTLSIDDLVYNENLDRIDFIKMDIEGAELEALNGGINTIQHYKPKLAISIYHNMHDFWMIPEWIEKLGLGYRFYIRHFTIHSEETVLFAIPYSS